MYKLTPREALVTEMRNGTGRYNGNRQTWKQIAQRLKLSEYRVKEIYKSAQLDTEAPID